MSRTILACLAVLLCVSVAEAKPEQWKSALNESLYTGLPIKLTKTSLSMNQIKEPGTLFILRKDGVSGTKAGEGFAANVVKDGAIVQKGSAMNMLLGGGANRRDFKAGDKFYLTDFALKDKQISFGLVSAITYDVTTNGTTKSERYACQLQFEFPDGYLASAKPADVQATIDAVVVPEGWLKADAPATVELGQSFEAVEKALGKPERVVNLGSKVTWVYKDMKVIFQDGKVADVQ